jgi:type II secretory pathway pseudopilin PulG
MRFSPRIFLGAVIAVVIAAIVAGLVLIGSPGEQRKQRFDERRAQDLAAISLQIRSYWKIHGVLPPTLDDLPPTGSHGHQDPRTGKPYEYAVLEGAHYRLCADFEAEASDEYPSWLGFGRHGKGHTCFEQEAAKAPR